MASTYRIPSVDVAFLTAWSPARFLLLGFAGYAIAWLLSPLQYDNSMVTLDGLLALAVMTTGLFAGCYVATALSRYMARAVPQPTMLSPDSMINLALLIGGLGVASRFYDRVVLRGFSVTATYLETRETVAEALSPLSYVGGFGFTFGMVALLLIWLSSSQTRRPVAFGLAVALAVYPMVETLLQGSRSTMVHSAFLVFLFARASKAMPWLVRSKLAIALGCVAIVGVAEVIYEVRSTEGVIDELDIADILKYAAISRYAAVPDWIVETLIASNGHGVVAMFLKGWVHMTQHLTHSGAVWFENFDQFDGVIGWGRMHLHMVFRLVSGLYGEDLTYDPAMHGMVVGVSTSAFSALYYDFGAASPLFAALFGFAATIVQRKAILYPERWLPLHAVLCLACLMWTIDNQLLSSLSAFAVWSFAAYVPLHYVVSVLSGEGQALAEAGAGPGVGAGAVAGDGFGGGARRPAE